MSNEIELPEFSKTLDELVGNMFLLAKSRFEATGKTCYCKASPIIAEGYEMSIKLEITKKSPKRRLKK